MQTEAECEWENLPAVRVAVGVHWARVVAVATGAHWVAAVAVEPIVDSARQRAPVGLVLDGDPAWRRAVVRVASAAHC